MHLSFIRLLVLFTSLLVHSQETNSSESATAVSAPISVYSNSLNDGEAFPPTQNISRLSAAVPTTSLCHLQASSKDPQPRAYANVQVVWTATPTLNVMVPGSSFVSTSIISPDATLSATVTAGRSSAVDASSKTVQSTTATMSASMGIASGNPSSTVNATNMTTTSAPTAALGKKNLAGQIRGFIGTVGLPFLIGAFVGFMGL